MFIDNYQVRKKETLFYLNFLFLSILIFMGKAIADTEDKINGLTVEEICRSVKDVSIPHQHMLDDATKKSLKSCDSENLYYGFDRTPDYIKARECALSINDYGTLAMIYGNGKGVNMDVNLAVHYACLLEHASQYEKSELIAHIYKRKEKKIGKDFKLCDGVVSPYMELICTGFHKRFSDAKQEKELDILTARMLPLEKKAFQKLQKASAVYFEAIIDNEMPRGGTGAASFGLMKEIELQQNMIEILDKTMQCNISIYTLEQYKKADNTLNDFYKKTQGKPDLEMGITSQGIKITERAWIKYKEAWVNLGQIKCSNKMATGLATLITKERIKILKEFIVDFNNSRF